MMEMAGEVIKNQNMKGFINLNITLQLYSVEILEAMRLHRQRSERINFRFEREYFGDPGQEGGIGKFEEQRNAEST